MSGNEALAEAVRTALEVVIDPELGENVVELGLIYAITPSEGGVVAIEMTTTTRGCPATGFLKQAVEDCAWEVPGVEFVDVRLTYEPAWSPAMMSDRISARLAR